MARGAYSEMYSAVPVASSIATTTATSAIRAVPTMTAAMPNWPPLAFHAWVVRNDQPALCSASHALIGEERAHADHDQQRDGAARPQAPNGTAGRKRSAGT